MFISVSPISMYFPVVKMLCIFCAEVILLKMEKHLVPEK